MPTAIVWSCASRVEGGTLRLASDAIGEWAGWYVAEPEEKVGVEEKSEEEEEEEVGETEWPNAGVKEAVTGVTTAKRGRWWRPELDGAGDRVLLEAAEEPGLAVGCR